MKALWRRFVSWLAWSFPTDEALEADTPELREFVNRIQQARSRRSA